MTIDGYQIKHAVEVGAGDAQSSQLLQHAPVIDRVTLIEPNILLSRPLMEVAARNVMVCPVAVGAVEGFVQLVHMGYGSFIKGAPAFLPLSCEADCEEYWKLLTRPVPLMTLSEVTRERGPIDWLVLTCNGSELGALTTLTNAPVAIDTKAYLHNGCHHEAYHDVMNWLVYNGYRAAELIETNLHHTYAHTRWLRKKRV